MTCLVSLQYQFTIHQIELLKSIIILCSSQHNYKVSLYYLKEIDSDKQVERLILLKASHS